MKAPLLSPFCHWSWIVSSCGSKWPPCCSNRQPVPRCAMGHRKLPTSLAAEKPGDPRSWKVYQIDCVDGLSGYPVILVFFDDSFIHCIICITHLSFCHFPWPRVFCPRKVVVQTVASKASSRGSAIGGCKPMSAVKGALFGNDAFV